MTETLEEFHARLDKHVLGVDPDEMPTFHSPISDYVKFMPPIDLVGKKMYINFDFDRAMMYEMLKELREIKEILKNK